MTSNFITRDAATGLHENSNNKVLTIFSRILLDHDLHSGLYKFCLRHPLQAAHLLSSRQIVHLLALGSAFPLVPWTSKWLLHCSWVLPFLLSLLLVSPSLLVYVVTVESVLLLQWRRHQRFLKTGILKSSVVISHDSRVFLKKRFVILKRFLIMIHDSWFRFHPGSRISFQPQVAQARNMSIGEHRHCCVTFKI